MNSINTGTITPDKKGEAKMAATTTNVVNSLEILAIFKKVCIAN